MVTLAEGKSRALVGLGLIGFALKVDLGDGQAGGFGIIKRGTDTLLARVILKLAPLAISQIWGRHAYSDLSLRELHGRSLLPG